MFVDKRITKRDIFCTESLASILLSNLVKELHKKFPLPFCNLQIFFVNFISLQAIDHCCKLLEQLNSEELHKK
jgi:hypothetical protein